MVGVGALSGVDRVASGGEWVGVVGRRGRPVETPTRRRRPDVRRRPTNALAHTGPTALRVVARETVDTTAAAPLARLRAGAPVHARLRLSLCRRLLVAGTDVRPRSEGPLPVLPLPFPRLRVLVVPPLPRRGLRLRRHGQVQYVPQTTGKTFVRVSFLRGPVLGS